MQKKKSSVIPTLGVNRLTDNFKQTYEHTIVYHTYKVCMKHSLFINQIRNFNYTHIEKSLCVFVYFQSNSQLVLLCEQPRSYETPDSAYSMNSYTTWNMGKTSDITLYLYSDITSWCLRVKMTGTHQLGHQS